MIGDQECEALLERAISLYRQGLFDEARKLCHSILSIDRRNLDARRLLAALEGKIGNHLASLALFDEIFRLRPDCLEVLTNRGLALQFLERWEDAIDNYDQAIVVKPDGAEAYCKRGAALQKLERSNDAVDDYDKAARINPQLIDAHYNRGVTLAAQGQWQGAVESYDRVTQLKPDFAPALYDRGVVLQKLRRWPRALTCYDRAIHLKPDYVEALNNRGTVLQELRRWTDAVASYDQAILFKPDYVHALTNKGTAQEELVQWRAALTSYGRAIQLNSEYAEAHWNQALVLLRLGRFSEGWREHEWRLDTAEMKGNYHRGSQISWRGTENIENKRILIQCEQGLGDSIQFVRYLLGFLKLGAQVLLEVQKPLLSLFVNMQIPVTIIAKGEALPTFDAYCPLMSLPYVFNTTMATIPAPIPYLYPDQEKVTYWKQRLGSRNRFRVGLVWSGSATHKNDSRRSIPLKTLLPLLDLPFEWHSLQKEYRELDMKVLDREFRIQRHERYFSDFSQTAALVECLDLVISADTSIAHLAGAMGKPVWVLLPFKPDFRWLLELDYSPWYPTAKLFRQDERRDWGVVILAVSTALSEIVSKPPHRPLLA